MGIKLTYLASRLRYPVSKESQKTNYSREASIIPLLLGRRSTSPHHGHLCLRILQAAQCLAEAPLEFVRKCLLK